jgi:hypothetical protein
MSQEHGTTAISAQTKLIQHLSWGYTLVKFVGVSNVLVSNNLSTCKTAYGNNHFFEFKSLENIGRVKRGKG